MMPTGMNTEPTIVEFDKDNDPRGDGWFVTRSGLRFYPLNPRAEEVLIEDIAFALSNISRFGGHVNFFSVAEHSCNVSDHCPDELKLLGLLHDATEAYLGDVVRPLKQQLPEYREAEHRMWGVISGKFGLPAFMPKSIKDVDNRALLAERNALMNPGPNTRDWGWDGAYEPLPLGDLYGWHPARARYEFMKRFWELSK